jgi:outer membrane immunogenic protein
MTMRLGALAAFAAAILVIPSAQAAGAKVAPVTSAWTGCYVGGNVGAGWEGTDVVDEVEGYPIASMNASSVLGGGQIGCDYQFAPQWVIGAQGLWDATGLKDTAYPDLLEGAGLSGNIDWVATATGRIGYLPAPDWLIYAKGGLAWNSTHSSITEEGETIDSVRFSQTGWTAGVGAEWKASRHWSLFGEYDYLGFNTTTVSYPNTENIGNVKQNVQAVLFGANYHFN